MKAAIQKLKDLAQDNNDIADAVETGKFEIIGLPPERTRNLVKTYRYWGQCLYIAAWLLEKAEP